MAHSTENIIIITSYVDAPFDMKQALTQMKDPYIICTDGGFDLAKQAGITPHLLLGDLDSIQSRIPKELPLKTFPPEKDYTDLELAIHTAIEKKASHVEIWGGIGGRLDHTVANLQLLSCYAEQFRSLSMHDGQNRCFVLNAKGTQKSITIPQEKDCYLSLFSLSETVQGRTAKGVKYPLQNHTLTRTFPLGVSNEFKQKEAFLSLEKGSLLIVLAKA